MALPGRGSTPQVHSEKFFAWSPFMSLSQDTGFLVRHVRSFLGAILARFSALPEFLGAFVVRLDRYGL